MTENSRLHIYVKSIDKHYYDIGLRRDNKQLSRVGFQFGEYHPRFLEDFVQQYGYKNIKIVSLGKLFNEMEYIKGLDVEVL